MITARTRETGRKKWKLNTRRIVVTVKLQRIRRISSDDNDRLTAFLNKSNPETQKTTERFERRSFNSVRKGLHASKNP